jgi:hypothetical protein
VADAVWLRRQAAGEVGPETERSEGEPGRKKPATNKCYGDSIAMFDLETNKAIARRLIEVFNGRRLDLLEGDKVVLVDRFGGTHRGEFRPAHR